MSELADEKKDQLMSELADELIKKGLADEEKDQLMSELADELMKKGLVDKRIS